MVKDNWSSLNSTSINTTENQAHVQPIQNDGLYQQDKTSLIYVANDDSKSINNNNPWGEYGSKDNFINLHLC